MKNSQENKSAQASRENFWTLLSEKQYTICIPRIQRDYAQGRKEPEPTQIRQAFIKDVFNALMEGEPLDINFIYGNIDIDQRGVRRFIPIDGQQRLTTLFLLHWYFASWSNRLDEDNKEVLSRFQYETRFVTGDFCNRLVNEVNIDLKDLVAKGERITNYIKDYFWFFSAYERDATISAMLVMLEDIHSAVKRLPDNSAVDSFFEVLTDANGPISFLFLDIADIGLTDEIYIKMNARGKALTRFENFKAQLSSYLSKKDEEFSRNLIGKINGEWSQFFWHEEYRPLIQSSKAKKGERKSAIFDDQIMNLFRFIMMNDFICNVELDDNTTETKYLIRNVMNSLTKESDFQFTNHLFYDEFRTVSNHETDKANVDEGAFHFIFRLLNTLSRRKELTGSILFADSSLYNKEYINEENYFCRLIRSSSERELSYEDQILLYAEFCFLVKYSNEDYSFDKERELTEWLRFIFNLTRSVRYNTVDDYFRSIRRVRMIIEEEDDLDILKYAATLLRREYRQGSGYGFVERQVAEEGIKANLILRGSKWRNIITLAENSFLGNQLASILSFSGIWTMYDLQMSEFEFANPKVNRMPMSNSIMNELDDNDCYFNSLELYLKKINMIFDKDDVRPELEQCALFRRALLTFGGADSYMLPPGKAIRCFLDATDRDTSFRRLLGGDFPDNRGYFKDLLDIIDENKEIVPQLENVIECATFDEENRWKKYFVEMPEILDSMYQNRGAEDPSGGFVFRHAKRYICMRDVDRILLLERTITTSFNREYYSYVLYLKARKQGFNVGYFLTYNENTEKYLYYINNQDSEVQVLYMIDESDDSNKYKYVARKNGEVLYKSNMDNMLDYIQQTIKH